MLQIIKTHYNRALSSFINKEDKNAYKGGHNSTMGLLICQHKWLSWLDKDIDFVRVFTFDSSKAFDMVSHHILCDKLQQLNLN